MKIGELTVGIDFKRCSECEYKRGFSIRDELLITAGARAAYMACEGIINIESGLEGELHLANFVTRMIDNYMRLEDTNFDLYIEERLLKEFKNED